MLHSIHEKHGYFYKIYFDFLFIFNLLLLDCWSKEEPLGLERKLRSERHALFFQRTWVLFLHTHRLTTPFPGDLTFWLLQASAFTYTYLHNTDTHTHTLN